MAANAGSNNGDEVAALLFWGGEIIKRGVLSSLDYSLPPMAMCFLSRASRRLCDLTAKVHTAINNAASNGENNATGLALSLFGRYPMMIPGDKVVFVSIPLTDDPSYCWFLDEAPLLSKPLHIYAIPSPKAIIDDDKEEEEEEEQKEEEEEEKEEQKGEEQKEEEREEEEEEEEKEKEADSNGRQLPGEGDTSEVTLVSFVSQAYDNAMMDPCLCESLADVCYQLESIMWPSSRGGVTFKKLLLNLCQHDFERGLRRTGNVRLIGELYQKKQLTGRILHACIVKLVECFSRVEPEEEDVEALCILMYAAGESMDRGFREDRRRMGLYFQVIEDLSNLRDMSGRLKEMLRHLVGLREREWRRNGSDRVGEMKIFGRTLTGRRRNTVRVDLSGTAEELKRKIEDKEGFTPPAEQHRLVFGSIGSCHLEDHRTLDQDPE